MANRNVYDMDKQKVALVLSMGGARGIAHIGVIEELLRHNFEITSIAGSSMGAMVGAMYASGKMEECKEWLYSWDKRKMWELAEKGYFVCGSRVLLGRMATARLLRGVETHPALFKQDLSFLLNAFRSHTLRLYLANRYAKNSMLRIRGCNMAFWKEDLLRVNGYNESLEMWGQEDVEISYRLIHAGIQKKQLKMGGVQFHLYHKFASRENLEYHEQVLRQVIAERIVWCENGIVKEGRKV